MDRVMVFIDGSNFYYACKASGITNKIDFYKLGSLLAGKERKLIRIYYYNSAREKDENDPESVRKHAAQQRFFDALKRMPHVTLVQGRLEKRQRKCKKCNEITEVYVEKATDMNLGVDMVVAGSRNNCDVVVLVSADGDFTKAVDALKEMGKTVEVACFKGHSSRHLNEKADRVYWFNEMDLSSCTFAS